MRLKPLRTHQLCHQTTPSPPRCVAVVSCVDGRLPGVERLVYNVRVVGNMLERVAAPPPPRAGATPTAPAPAAAAVPATAPSASLSSTPRVGIDSLRFLVEHCAVDTIVILGHSDCAAIHNRDTACGGAWAADLQLPAGAEATSRDSDRLRDRLSQRNVLLQLRNLRSAPFFASRERAGTLALQGTFVKTDSGKVYHLNEVERRWDEVATPNACGAALGHAWQRLSSGCSSCLGACWGATLGRCCAPFP